MTDCLQRVDDRLLALVADDGGARDLDPDVVGDLQLHGLRRSSLVIDAVDAAGGDDPVADLQRGEERLHLLLPLLHRQQDDEVEDAEDQRERNELQPRIWAALLGRGHGQPGTESEKSNPSMSHESTCRRESRPKELLPETFERPKRYSLPDPSAWCQGKRSDYATC